MCVLGCGVMIYIGKNVVQCILEGVCKHVHVT